MTRENDRRITKRDQFKKEPAFVLGLTRDLHSVLSAGSVYTYYRFICICTRRHACGPSDVRVYKPNDRTGGGARSLRKEEGAKGRGMKARKRGREKERERERTFPSISI